MGAMYSEERYRYIEMCIRDRNGFVALVDVRDTGHIHHHLIHADPAQHRAGRAVDLHDALAAAELAGVAIGVAGAEAVSYTHLL